MNSARDRLNRARADLDALDQQRAALLELVNVLEYQTAADDDTTEDTEADTGGAWPQGVDLAALLFNGD